MGDSPPGCAENLASLQNIEVQFFRSDFEPFDLRLPPKTNALPAAIPPERARSGRESLETDAFGRDSAKTGALGPGFPPKRTPASFSGSATVALEYGLNHSKKYLWRYCPSTLDGIHDIRSRTGIRRLNRLMPDRNEAITHEGHIASVAWAKWKNLESGKKFDKVLVPRKLLRQELGRVKMIDITSLPAEAERILQEQQALWDDRLNSYFPQSAFARNEAALRQLLFPGADPSDAECVHSQPFREIAREILENGPTTSTRAPSQKSKMQAARRRSRERNNALLHAARP